MYHGFIPLQHLDTARTDNEMDFSRDSEPTTLERVASQIISSGPYNEHLDKYSLETQKSPRRAGYGRLASAWWQEIISFLFATVLFVVIAAILAKYNGQEQPESKYSLNLSTLVAILSTLMRASLVVVVEEGKYDSTLFK